MENGAEALKMAFAIIMFVLALSLSISSFSQAREAVDAIVTMKDRETYYTYVEKAEAANREVGVETIVPTLYKAYKENFEVHFHKADGSELVLYDTIDPNGILEHIHVIDLKKEKHPNQDRAVAQLNGLLRNGSYRDNTGKEVKSPFGSLYDYFEDKKFIETLGEYYQEDAENNPAMENLHDVNKSKKRVITYTLTR